VLIGGNGNKWTRTNTEKVVAGTHKKRDAMKRANREKSQKRDEEGATTTAYRRDQQKVIGPTWEGFLFEAGNGGKMKNPSDEKTNQKIGQKGDCVPRPERGGCQNQ